MKIKHLAGACALAAALALGAAGSASALIYEQVYAGVVASGSADSGLFGGVFGGEAFTVRYVTDTTLGSGVVDGPDGQVIQGGYSLGASAPVTAFVTINGHTLSFTDNLEQSRSQISSSPGQLDLTNQVVYAVGSVSNLYIGASAHGIGPATPVTFGQSYAMSSFFDFSSSLILFGALDDRGIVVTMTPTSAYGRVVSAVPEPATWAMMMSGFVTLGGALRANRRRQAGAG